MKRLLSLFAAACPGTAFAHAGHHGMPAGDTILHVIGSADHALILIAVLTLPVAVLILARRT